jgi:hypothetical protein
MNHEYLDTLVVADKKATKVFDSTYKKLIGIIENTTGNTLIFSFDPESMDSIRKYLIKSNKLKRTYKGRFRRTVPTYKLVEPDEILIRMTIKLIGFAQEYKLQSRYFYCKEGWEIEG